MSIEEFKNLFVEQVKKSLTTKSKEEIAYNQGRAAIIWGGDAKH